MRIVHRLAPLTLLLWSLPVWSGAGAQPLSFAPQAPSSLKPPAAPERLVPWKSHETRKRVITANDLHFAFKNRIDIKFREGSGVRSRKSLLTIEENAVRGIAPRTELARVNEILSTTRRHVAVRMHDLPENKVAALKRNGEANTGQEVPDLNLWFHIYVEVDSDEALAKLINRFNALNIVEIAYASPFPLFPGLDQKAAEEHLRNVKKQERLPFPSAADIERIEKGRLPSGVREEGAPLPATVQPPAKPVPPASTSPSEPQGSALVPNMAVSLAASVIAAAAAHPLPADFEPLQDYGEASPIGVDVDYLRGSYWGAFGNNAYYTNVEYAWNFFHQDLTDSAGAVLVNGQPAAAVSGVSYRNHGTSVIGEISSDASNPSWGTTGLAPDAQVRLSTEWPTSGSNRPAAINAAASQFYYGAVILLEMQTGAGFDCNGDGIVAPLNSPAADLVPAEWDPNVKAAVKNATANGRIVIAAAGNGNCNLDHPGFFGAFSPYNVDDPFASVNQVDSGAIIVGAADKFTRNKAGFSTYGKRVNVQSEGDFKIVTAGAGDKYSAEGQNLWYTGQFAGTSGASPIVTGSAVALAGILYNYHGSAFAPREMRQVLRLGASPQQPNNLQNIGPRPNLRRAVEHINNRHLQMQSADFDGDNRSDYAVWNPDTGNWTIKFSSGGTLIKQWGAKGDIPCPANMVGDKRAELVVFRPTSGMWHIFNLQNNTIKSVQWGTLGDIPVPLDYDGDKYADYAVFRSANSQGQPVQWHIKTSVTNKITSIAFGHFGTTPLARDFDGDGKDDLTVYYAGKWEIRPSTTPLLAVVRTLGQYGDVPLAYKSNGKWNLAVWRPSSANNGLATFYTKSYSANVLGSTLGYGVAGDVPRFADTDGNGTDEYIVYRQPGRWFNATFGAFILGTEGNLAIAK